jgi:hypothetical protein
MPDDYWAFDLKVIYFKNAKVFFRNIWVQSYLYIYLITNLVTDVRPLIEICNKYRPVLIELTSKISELSCVFKTVLPIISNKETVLTPKI